MKVTKGENRGKTVVQQNVVTELVKLGAFRGGVKRYTLPAAADPALKTAILVQASRAGVCSLRRCADRGVRGVGRAELGWPASPGGWGGCSGSRTREPSARPT